MEITPYGFATYRLQGKSIDILINPASNATGYRPAQLTPDLVLITSEQDYTDLARATEAMVFDRPGEYEFHSSEIRGFQMGEAATAYVFDIDDLKVVYLGEATEAPTGGLLEAATDAELLMLPVGGGGLLTAKQAAEIIGTLSPRVVIPTHYQTDSLKLSGYDKPDAFVKELGLTPQKDEKLKLTRKDLPEELELVVLEPK